MKMNRIPFPYCLWPLLHEVVLHGDLDLGHGLGGLLLVLLRPQELGQRGVEAPPRGLAVRTEALDQTIDEVGLTIFLGQVVGDLKERDVDLVWWPLTFELTLSCPRILHAASMRTLSFESESFQNPSMTSLGTPGMPPGRADIMIRASLTFGEKLL